MGDVAIFYYPWYGTEASDGAWQHWQQHGNTPPSQHRVGWFPARGRTRRPIPRVVRAQMREIASVGVQTVIVSWWGPGSVEAARLPAVMRGGTSGRASSRAARRAVRRADTGAARARDPGVRGRRDHRLLHLRLDDDADADWRALNAGLTGVEALRQHGPAG